MKLHDTDKAIFEVAKGWHSIISCLEPTDEEAKINTQNRIVESIRYILSGYLEDPESYIKDFDFVESDDLVIVKNIPFFSLCKHHILPFFGKAHVGYLPDKKIVGLSKIARIVKGYSQRLQLQEKLGREICRNIYESPINPKGVIAVLEAQHLCMQMRGIESIGSITTTASLLGEFEKNSELKREFYHLIGVN